MSATTLMGVAVFMHCYKLLHKLKEVERNNFTLAVSTSICNYQSLSNGDDWDFVD